MNTMTIKLYIIIIGVTLTILGMGNIGFAQDVEECQDHPLLARMKHFLITECEQSFDALEITIAEDTIILAEGYLDRTEYAYKGAAEPPTAQQIKRHYANAVHNLGGEVLYEQENSVTYHVVRNGNEFFIVLQTDDASYTLRILQVEGLIQDMIARFQGINI